MPHDFGFALEIGAVAVLVGAFGAIMGIGGGLLLVPILLTFFHQDVHTARLASLVAVCVTSAAGSLVYLKEGAVDLGKASYLQLPTAIGAVGGAFLGKAVSEDLVRILFSAILVFTAFRMAGKGKECDPEKTEPSRRQWMLAGLACMGAGVVSSLLGVGGGIVFVPVLALLLCKTPRQAAATSTYLIGLTGAASALVYLQGTSDPRAMLAVAVPSAIGILIGAQTGARLSSRIPGGKLRVVFALVLVANASLLTWKVFNG